MPSVEAHALRPYRRNLLIPGLSLALAAAALWSLTIGRYPVPTTQILQILFSHCPFLDSIDYDNVPLVIVEIVRLPRVLLVILCGMSLAMAGAALQGVFRNPLVGPEVCGVSAGASFGGVLAIIQGWSITGMVAMAFAFGVAALAAAFLLTRLAQNRAVVALVLAGIIIGSFFSALVGTAQYFADPQTKLPSIIYWLLGSFADANANKVGIVAVNFLLAGTALLALRWRINLLSLGDTDAEALGIHIERLRWTVVALVSLLVAAQVSVSGGVGWVGLVVPHIARMAVGPNHAKLLPASALLGGLYLLVMDDIARTVAVDEIPIGLLTAIIGTPAFAAIFWKLKGKGWSND
jgi:iron complex transport system permease protein